LQANFHHRSGADGDTANIADDTNPGGNGIAWRKSRIDHGWRQFDADVVQHERHVVHGVWRLGGEQGDRRNPEHLAG
jgi:hypothetical protein